MTLVPQPSVALTLVLAHSGGTGDRAFEWHLRGKQEFRKWRVREG